MDTQEKLKMLAMLAALTAQAIENLKSEMSDSDFEVLAKANEFCWKNSIEISSVEFYRMAKSAEKITGFSTQKEA